MRDAFYEFLAVLAYSTRTQWAILAGVGFFVGITLLGDYFTSHFEIYGLLSPLTDVIREKIAHRYDKAAWASLGAFFLLAIKLYKKDRKRLLGL